MVATKSYFVQLYNTDPALDLTKKEKEIASVIKEVKDSKIGLTSILDFSVEQHSFKITVKEANDHWHTKIGQKLANEKNMRIYCKENEKSKMFNWKVV